MCRGSGCQIWIGNGSRNGGLKQRGDTLGVIDGGLEFRQIAVVIVADHQRVVVAEMEVGRGLRNARVAGKQDYENEKPFEHYTPLRAQSVILTNIADHLEPTVDPVGRIRVTATGR